MRGVPPIDLHDALDRPLGDQVIELRPNLALSQISAVMIGIIFLLWALTL